MNELTLEKLQWSQLCEALSSEAQTQEGRDSCLRLRPEYAADEIEKRWHDVIPLRDLQRAGYKAPIGDLPPMQGVFRAVSLGQILDGEQIWSVYMLLHTVRSVHQFAMDRQDRCRTLVR